MTDEQIQAIQVGDVLRMPSDTLRVVLDVSRWKHTTSVRFMILRPSWTNRPFTVYTTQELKRLEPTGFRLSSRAVKQMRGRLLQIECHERGFCSPGKTLTDFHPIVESWDSSDGLPS